MTSSGREEQHQPLDFRKEKVRPDHLRLGLIYFSLSVGCLVLSAIFGQEFWPAGGFGESLLELAMASTGVGYLGFNFLGIRSSAIALRAKPGFKSIGVTILNVALAGSMLYGILSML